MGKSSEGVARLACFELWGGNGKSAHEIELPGLLGWICCTPFGHATGGGDVHYMSVCSKGQVSRIALADVAGHGESASSLAERLRRVLQQHTDNWDQSALMRELNEAFQRDAKGVQFATAVVLGFYFGTGQLLFTNAGHLRPGLGGECGEFRGKGAQEEEQNLGGPQATDRKGERPPRQ